MGVGGKESSRLTLLATVLELRESQLLANLETVLEGLSDLSSVATAVLLELLLPSPPQPPPLLVSPTHLPNSAMGSFAPIALEISLSSVSTWVFLSILLD